MGLQARAPRRPSLQRRYFVIPLAAAIILFALLLLATSWNVLLTWILAWTPVGLLLYVYDKIQAQRGRLRLPEINLLVVAALGGFAGALAGMLLVRHKTRKPLFWIVNVGSAIAYVLLLVVTIM